MQTISYSIGELLKSCLSSSKTALIKAQKQLYIYD